MEYLEVWEEEAKGRRVMVLAPDLSSAVRNGTMDLKLLYELVDEIASRFPVDKERMILAGVSAGALIARRMLIDRPSYKWKAVIFIASPDDPWPSYVDVKSFPSVLFVHGAYDDQFKLENIKQSVMSLKEKGVDTELIQDPEGGHEHNEEWNKEIFDWIEAHSSIK